MDAAPCLSGQYSATAINCPPAKQWPQEGSHSVGFDPVGWEWGPHFLSARWLEGPGDRVGGRWLEAKRCKKCQVRPIFQGRVDSRCEKREGTGRAGAGAG